MKIKIYLEIIKSYVIVKVIVVFRSEKEKGKADISVSKGDKNDNI